MKYICDATRILTFTELIINDHSVYNVGWINMLLIAYFLSIISFGSGILQSQVITFN